MTYLLVLLVAYSLSLIAVGVWISRRVRGSSEFFVGNRALGPALIFATFLAPNLGAGSTVGATDLAYREGLSAWWWNGSAGLGSLVLAFWVGPRIWREASRLELLTVGDFLEHHYGPGFRILSAAVIWIGTLWILCGQLNGIAAILALPAAGGLPHWLGCLIGTAVLAAYFVGGGLASAARVNAMQLAVKLAGFALAVPLAVGLAGGWGAIQHANPERWDFWGVSGSGDGWPMLFLTAPAFFLSPGLLQKAFGARDERALRLGVGVNAAALMAFAAMPVMLGLAARTAFPDLAKDAPLPTILSAMPLAIGGLALAAVFSAELSAADAVLFMFSTSGARDVYRALVRPQATDAELLRAARVAALLGGALGFALTFVYPTVLGALKLFYAILVVSLFAPTLGALVRPRVGARPAFAAVAVGLAVLSAATLTTGRPGWMTPSFLGLVTSTAAFFIGSRRSAARL